MDVTKICSSVVSKFNQIKTRLMVAALALSAAVVCGPSAFAQTATTIPVDVPDLDYAGVATSLLTAIIPGLVAAIGLGLSIWGLAFIYRKFKAMGR